MTSDVIEDFVRRKKMEREMAERGATCSSCAHYDANSSATEGVGYCTNPNSWHRAKAMPPHEMCSKWEKADE